MYDHLELVIVSQIRNNYNVLPPDKSIHHISLVR
jgi:hypothetical protein